MFEFSIFKLKTIFKMDFLFSGLNWMIAKSVGLVPELRHKLILSCCRFRFYIYNKSNNLHVVDSWSLMFCAKGSNKRAAKNRKGSVSWEVKFKVVLKNIPSWAFFIHFELILVSCLKWIHSDWDFLNMVQKQWGNFRFINCKMVLKHSKSHYFLHKLSHKIYIITLKSYVQIQK